MMQQQESKHDWRAAIILLLLLCVTFAQVFADPSGASLDNRSTVSGPARTPGNRSDARGTITTMNIDSIQQDSRWKAYVGNVTGQLTLQNPAGSAIYSWDLTTITGEIYASRYSSVGWTSVACASPALVRSEQDAFVMTGSNPDRINATFNWTVHKSFTIGANPPIAQSTCPSTVTYVNNARPVPTTSSPFQEILINDSNNNLVYLTDIVDNVAGYDNQAYDFQLIVPENITGNPTTYYFYTELG